MKKALLDNIEETLLLLTENECQSIEIRGAIHFGIQFKAALQVIPDEQLVLVKNEKEEKKNNK